MQFQGSTYFIRELSLVAPHGKKYQFVMLSDNLKDSELHSIDTLTCKYLNNVLVMLLVHKDKPAKHNKQLKGNKR